MGMPLYSIQTMPEAAVRHGLPDCRSCLGGRIFLCAVILIYYCGFIGIMLVKY